MMTSAHPVHSALRVAEFAVQELAELEALLGFQPWVEDARKALALFSPADEDSVADLEMTVTDLLAAFTERLEELSAAHPDAVSRPRPDRQTRVNYANQSRRPHPDGVISAHAAVDAFMREGS